MEPNIKYFKEDCNFLIENIRPIPEASLIRNKITNFLRQIIVSKLPTSHLILCGSTSSRTYLPDGDLDLVFLSNHQHTDELQQLTCIFTTLCEEIYRKEEGQSLYPDLTIRNVEFINARTKLIHCIVNNVGVDITVNQIGSMASILFLEKVSQLIAENHLFKRSMLLIKAWCQIESESLGGQAMLGAKVGMFSSYALSILVIHLFCRYAEMINHPFVVLYKFLEYYHNFPWESYVLTLQGPQPIQHGPSNSNSSSSRKDFESHKLHLCSNRFKNILSELLPELQPIYQYHKMHSGQRNKFNNPSIPSRFSIRCCNILDPIDETNNLGISVSRSNLFIIEKALSFGLIKIESLIYQGSLLPPLSPPMQQMQQMQPMQQLQPMQQMQQMQPMQPMMQLQPMMGPSTPSNSSHHFVCHPHTNNNNNNKGNKNNIPMLEIPQPYPVPIQPQLHPHPEQAYLIYHQTAPPHPMHQSGPVLIELKPQHGFFLNEFFGKTIQRYFSVQRNDLLDHPMQNARLNPPPLRPPNDPSILQDDIYNNELTDIQQAFKLLTEEMMLSQALESPTSVASPAMEPERIIEPPNLPEPIPIISLVETTPTDVSTIIITEAEKDIVQEISPIPIEINLPIDPIDRIESPEPSQDTLQSNEILETQSFSTPQTNKSNNNKAKKKRNSLSNQKALKVPSPPSSPRIIPANRELPLERPRSTSRPLVISLSSSSLSSSPSNSAKSKPPCPHSLLSSICHQCQSNPLFSLVNILSFLVFVLSIIVCIQSNILPFTLYSTNTISQSSTSIKSNPVITFDIKPLSDLKSRQTTTTTTPIQLSQSNLEKKSLPNPSSDHNSSLEGPNTEVFTNWVLLGESLSFGLFDDRATSDNPNQISPLSQSNAYYLWKKDNMNLTTSTLPYYTIHTSRLIDAGHYQLLKIIQNHSYLLAETRVKIAKKPKIKNRPFYQELKSGKTFYLKLDVDAIPPPSFQWFRNGYKLDGYNKQELFLDILDTSHSGTYSCEVSNLAGTYLWLEATLAVLD